MLTLLAVEFSAIVDKFIKPRSKTTVVVDFGCGNQPYRPLFAPFVADYIAYDLDGNEFADRVMPKPSVLDLESESVDVVLSSQVLEHVESPAGYLLEAARVLRPGGLLVLSTHGNWRFHPDPGDYYRWTSQGLRSEIERAGFETIRFSGILGPAATAWQLWQDASANRLPKRLRPLFFRYCQWRLQLADRACKDVDRDADACVYVTVSVRTKK